MPSPSIAKLFFSFLRLGLAALIKKIDLLYVVIISGVVSIWLFS